MAFPEGVKLQVMLLMGHGDCGCGKGQNCKWLQEVAAGIDDIDLALILRKRMSVNRMLEQMFVQHEVPIPAVEGVHVMFEGDTDVPLALH